MCQPGLLSTGRHDKYPWLWCHEISWKPKAHFIHSSVCNSKTVCQALAANWSVSAPSWPREMSQACEQRDCLSLEKQACTYEIKNGSKTISFSFKFYLFPPSQCRLLKQKKCFCHPGEQHSSQGGEGLLMERHWRSRPFAGSFTDLRWCTLSLASAKSTTPAQRQMWGGNILVLLRLTPAEQTHLLLFLQPSSLGNGGTCKRGSLGIVHLSSSSCYTAKGSPCK